MFSILFRKGLLNKTHDAFPKVKFIEENTKESAMATSKISPSLSRKRSIAGRKGALARWGKTKSRKTTTARSRSRAR